MSGVLITTSLGLEGGNNDVAKRAKAKRLKDRAPTHDGLHGKYDTCYCTNKCCWYSWYHLRSDGIKVLLGICICPECPCPTPRLSGISGKI